MTRRSFVWLCAVLAALIAVSFSGFSVSAEETHQKLFSMNEGLNTAGSGSTAATEAGIAGQRFDGAGWLYGDISTGFDRPLTVVFAAKLDESYTSGFLLILARDEKASLGHFEIYITNGKLAVYAPNMLGGNPIISDVDYSDRELHVTAVAFDAAEIRFYDNGVLGSAERCEQLPAAAENSMLSVGGGNSGEFPFNGFIGGLEVFDGKMSASEVAAEYTAITGKQPVPAQHELLFSLDAEAAGMTQIGSGATASSEADIDGFAFDGAGWLSGELRTGFNRPITIIFAARADESYETGFGLILARDEKASSGHLEVYLDQGRLAVYAPNIGVVLSGISYLDHELHISAITIDGTVVRFYDAGAETQKTGIAAFPGEAGNSVITVGAGNASEFPFAGFIGGLEVYAGIMNADEIAAKYELLLNGPPVTTGTEDVPPETVPPETQPPETQPPETQPPVNPKTGDGYAALLAAAFVSAATAAVLLRKRRA